MESLEAQAPLNRKSVRANDGHVMTKDLRKAIRNRPKLRNNSNKARMEKIYSLYKKQRNTYASLLRIYFKVKFPYYGSWNARDGCNRQLKILENCETDIFREDQCNLSYNPYRRKQCC